MHRLLDANPATPPPLPADVHPATPVLPTRAPVLPVRNADPGTPGGGLSMASASGGQTVELQADKVASLVSGLAGLYDDGPVPPVPDGDISPVAPAPVQDSTPEPDPAAPVDGYGHHTPDPAPPTAPDHAPRHLGGSAWSTPFPTREEHR